MFLKRCTIGDRKAISLILQLQNRKEKKNGQKLRTEEEKKKANINYCM